MASLTQEEYDKLRVLFRSSIRTFASGMFGIDLTEDQYKFIVQATKPGSKLAIKSCTGSGKTLGLSILILQQLLVNDDIKIIATSPSAGQLQRGMKAEITKLISKIKIPEFRDSYVLMAEELHIRNAKGIRFCSFVTGSAENKESLAGVHAERVIIIVDEASAIAQEIYDTLIGNLTTPNCSIIQTSNPVRPDGPFFNIFNNDDAGKNWTKITLTAFGVPHIDPQWIEDVKVEYGEDSDFYRMRVLGEFPRVSDENFIPTDVVDDACSHFLKNQEYINYPIVGSVDVARFGDDETVFVTRQGGKILDITRMKGLDNMEVVAELKDYYTKHRHVSIFVDSIGVGSGVFDRSKELRLPVIEVVVSTTAQDGKTYCNLRSELWGRMRDWLKNGADIPKGERDLYEQLTSMRYGYNGKMQIQLVSKKDMKKKYKKTSPDIADALALTFAGDVFSANTHKVQTRPIIKRNILWA